MNKYTKSPQKYLGVEVVWYTMTQHTYQVKHPNVFTIPSDDNAFEQFHTKMKTQHFLNYLYETLPVYEKNEMYKAFITEVTGTLLHSQQNYTTTDLFIVTAKYLETGYCEIPELYQVFNTYGLKKVMKLHTTLRLLAV